MDIVDRLRSLFNYDLCDYIEPAIPDIKEAADEIERLRQQNAKYHEAMNEILFRINNLPAVFNVKPDDPLFEIIRIQIAKTTGGE